MLVCQLSIIRIALVKFLLNCGKNCPAMIRITNAKLRLCFLVSGLSIPNQQDAKNLRDMIRLRVCFLMHSNKNELDF